MRPTHAPFFFPLLSLDRALLFPLRAALQGDGQSSWTVLVDGTVGDIKKSWNSFYSTFFRYVPETPHTRGMHRTQHTTHATHENRMCSD